MRLFLKESNSTDIVSTFLCVTAGGFAVNQQITTISILANGFYNPKAIDNDIPDTSIRLKDGRIIVVQIAKTKLVTTLLPAQA